VVGKIGGLLGGPRAKERERERERETPAGADGNNFESLL